MGLHERVVLNLLLFTTIEMMHVVGGFGSHKNKKARLKKA